MERKMNSYETVREIWYPHNGGGEMIEIVTYQDNQNTQGENYDTSTATEE